MADEEKEAEKSGATGVNKSLYLTKEADELLTRIKEVSRRSQSEVVSLMLEMYGPEVINDPDKLIR
jgi:hypothetical protein